MIHVVHGATGAQGGPLATRLAAAGHAVRGTRDASGGPRLDNGSIEALVAAYRGADGVFVHLPMGPEPVRVEQARNIVAAIATARPARVVVSTSGTIVDRPGTPLQAPDDSAIAILLRGVADTGVSHAIVATRLYLENLLLPIVFDAVGREGVLRYPIAADYRVSWSSHQDVAAVAERLLTDHAVTGLVGVGHLPGLQGPELAEGFASHLGRPVAFEPSTPQAFGALLAPTFGPAADAVVALYAALAQVPDNVIDDATSAQRLLGLHPRGVGDWLAATLAA